MRLYLRLRGHLTDWECQPSLATYSLVLLKVETYLPLVLEGSVQVLLAGGGGSWRPVRMNPLLELANALLCYQGWRHRRDEINGCTCLPPNIQHAARRSQTFSIISGQSNTAGYTFDEIWSFSVTLDMRVAMKLKIKYLTLWLRAGFMKNWNNPTGWCTSVFGGRYPFI